MSRTRIERRLDDVTARLKRARAELAVVDEQLAVMADAADDAQLRALVSETPLAEREHREARRHADALVRSRAAVMSTIAELERVLDDLLGRLVTGK
jgi:chromosome segregation ATPase